MLDALFRVHESGSQLARLSPKRLRQQGESGALATFYILKRKGSRRSDYFGQAASLDKASDREARRSDAHESRLALPVVWS
jgi:hypothetical protein